MYLRGFGRETFYPRALLVLTPLFMPFHPHPIPPPNAIDITAVLISGTAAVPGKHLSKECVMELAGVVGQVVGVSRVLYDLTDKPPGTIEWE